MTATTALLGSALLLPLLTASADLTVNNCDDAKQWHGASRETALVKEGSGAIRWVPSQSVELSTPQSPTTGAAATACGSGCTAPRPAAAA